MSRQTRALVAAFKSVVAALATRAAAAVVLMGCGVGCAVAGAAVLWGAGWALIAAAATAIALAVLLGWE